MRRIAFVWENFGPIHADRCDAVQKLFRERAEVHGIEICGSSSTYSWNPENGDHFKKTTLFPNLLHENLSFASRLRKLFLACYRSGARHIFLCHYEYASTFFAALMLRLTGRRVFVMNDLKFDDYKRLLWREIVKVVFYSPYVGGLASGVRSRDYLRFLGIPEACVVGVYNSMNIDRIRRLAGLPRAPGGTPFRERYFIIVARFVPKKNIETAIAAYALYCSATDNPRMLHIYGSGPLEGALRAQVGRLGLNDKVFFWGFQQAAAISRAFGSALALLLPSVEEQFGNVVIEAQAMGVPAIVSTNCGAADTLIRTGVNGFLAEPTNTEGFAFFMRLLADDESTWRSMSKAADRYISFGDANRFAEAVEYLTQRFP